MVRKTIALLLFTMLILQGGCIKEDLSECIFRLVLNFEPPDRSDDAPPFEVEVSNLSVFAFDANGVFTHEVKVSNPTQGSVVMVPAPAGTYTLVLWAGFTDEQLADANLQKGSTRIENFYMPAYTVSSVGKSVSADPLYYGIVHDAAIDLPPVILSQEVQLTQSAKPFRMRLAGLDQGEYRLVISNNAGKYSYENLLKSSGTGDNSTVEAMTEVPAATARVSDVPRATYMVRTGILWPVGLGDRDITIIDVKTGYTILTLSLAELLEKLDEVDFDQEAALNLIINYRSRMEIDVNLNGWWIINSNNEI